METGQVEHQIYISVKVTSDESLFLAAVAALRRDIPGLGTPKLHLLLQGTIKKSGIKMGRDKLGANI